MRIGVLGGIPPALGGGGLERQLTLTSDALRARGHEVVAVAGADAGASWDVLHAFGAEGDIQHALEHWTRNVSPLVLSPVIVVSPGSEERGLRIASTLARPVTPALMRRRALERADAVVAITEYERTLIERITRGKVKAHVVPNGVDPVSPAPASPVDVRAYVLLAGVVSERKRQRDVVEAIGPAAQIVVAGAYAGSETERARWDAAVASAGATWLGEVRDPAVMARLQRDALALVHLSRAEVQSLAVLETLAQATPVIVSDIPSHRELADAYPGWVRIAARASQLPGLLAQLRDVPPPPPAPSLPTWDDVAARLEAVYASVVGAD